MKSQRSKTRRRRLAILLAGAATAAGPLLGVTGAQAKRACVWWDINRPGITSNAAPWEVSEQCSPDVIPSNWNDYHYHENCDEIPPATFDRCVWAEFWLPGS